MGLPAAHKLRISERMSLSTMKAILLFLILLYMGLSDALQPRLFTCRPPQTRLYAAGATRTDAPQVFASGYSPKLDLREAIQEATKIALQALPKSLKDNSQIDLAFVTVSSLYDGQSSPSVVVPAVLESASSYGSGIQKLIGCTTGGIIASMANMEPIIPSEDEDDEEFQPRACNTVESEGIPGVAVTLCLLPDVSVKTFHVVGDDVPDDVGGMSADEWKRAVGLGNFDSSSVDHSTGSPIFFLVPSPAFQNDLDDMLHGLHYNFPSSTTFGGIASTVSSLSRARLFRFDSNDPQCVQTLADGCVGVALQGDIVAKTMVAQGAKPVGGIYRVVAGEGSTIKAVVLDEEPSEEEQSEELAGDDDQDDVQDSTAKAAAAYAKARIPKPVLAEANFLMRTLSDDDRSFMRKALLIGLERGGAIGRSPSELIRLAEGEGYQFSVHQVASAGMKDGSVTLPLGTVEIRPGTRLRFFVRESNFAKKEVQALWIGYKKRELTQAIQNNTKNERLVPSACVLMSTLDRGSKFFGGKGGFESNTVGEYIPSIPCVAGYFSNGVIGRLDDLNDSEIEHVYGSASGYTLLGSKSQRPVFSLAQVAAAEQEAAREEAEKVAKEKAMAAEDTRRTLRARSILDLDRRAPRDENGELILKRREVHSGRAISVSTVEWSVAEKTANPTSMLEGFMWDKETEVDRFRERVPLSNLVSQCRLSVRDPKVPKPRDWIGPVKAAQASGKFVLIPECKRIEPSTGSLRKRYDLEKLTKQFTLAGVPALSVNCDGVLFGGSVDDIGKARKAAGSAAVEVSSDYDGVIVPPILASDLILYPYQLYKLRLAGADAINLLAGALASKDLAYLTKIASSLQLQTLVTVTSTSQIEALTNLPKDSVTGLIVSNRELEDFSFDMTGEQALDLLRSDALSSFRSTHGMDVPVLVEGRVGIIERTDNTGETSSAYYLQELQDAGATGAIVGGSLALNQSDDAVESLETLLKLSSGSC